jgi:spermidine synthase
MFESYHTIGILITVIGVYGGTFLLVRLKKILLLTHRRFWNVLLLFSFIISGCSGIFLAILIDQNKLPVGYHKLLWFHVEFGIIMAIISFFHILWHVKYYTGIIKSIRQKC